MLQDLAPGRQVDRGLSNVSNGAPNHLRPYLNRDLFDDADEIQHLIGDLLDASITEFYWRLPAAKTAELVNLVARKAIDGRTDRHQFHQSRKNVKYVKNRQGASLAKCLFALLAGITIKR